MLKEEKMKKERNRKKSFVGRSHKLAVAGRYFNLSVAGSTLSVLLSISIYFTVLVLLFNGGPFPILFFPGWSDHGVAFSLDLTHYRKISDFSKVM